MIRLRRAYDAPGPGDGRRFLVDRLWPRGVRKEAVALEGWLKELAPSDDLRRWFGHEPDRFEAFADRYRRELDAHPEAAAPLLEAAREGNVTLVFAARDEDHNNAVVLRAWLEERLDGAPAGDG